MTQTTEASEEVMTSTPITQNQLVKSLSITIDSDSNLNLQASGSWSLHEMIGSLVLVGIDTYVNNRKDATIEDKLDVIINSLTAENANYDFKEVANKLADCANLLKGLDG